MIRLPVFRPVSGDSIFEPEKLVQASLMKKARGIPRNMSQSGFPTLVLITVF